MRLLLISNSTNPGEPYLDHAKNNIREFLGTLPLKALFIPYAAVTFPFDEYEAKVSEKFREIGHEIISIHRFRDPLSAVLESEVIVVGGGNTWKLLKMLWDNRLVEVIRNKVISGVPYVGWSAGSNVACPTIRTTNDMPITEPESFDSFNLIPFQINPHYIDSNPSGFAGETREQRIEEFIVLNPDVHVVGLREGTMLLIEDNSIRLIGPVKAKIFKKDFGPVELGSDDDFAFLLK
jgi:dipeptidase E